MDRHPSTAIESRLDTIAWAFLFLLVAAVALPTGTAERASVAGVGALMLGLNAYRAFVGLEVSLLGIVLGASCVVAGGAALAGFEPDLFVVFFVLAALVTLAAALRPETPAAR